MLTKIADKTKDASFTYAVAMHCQHSVHYQ